MCTCASSRLFTVAVCCILVGQFVSGTCFVFWCDLRHHSLSAPTIAGLCWLLVLVIGWVGLVVSFSWCGWRQWDLYHIKGVGWGCVNMPCVDCRRLPSFAVICRHLPSLPLPSDSGGVVATLDHVNFSVCRQLPSIAVKCRQTCAGALLVTGVA